MCSPASDFSWIPISTNRWYNFHLLDIQVGSHSLGLPSFVYWTTNDVIGTFIDSGTSVILTGPMIFTQLTAVFQQYYGNLFGISGQNNFFTGQCYLHNQVNSTIYPNVSFVAQDTSGKNVTLTVPPSAYIMEASGMACLGIGASAGLGVVLGDVFLENFYTVYDRQNLQIGFAPLKEPCLTF